MNVRTRYKGFRQEVLQLLQYLFKSVSKLLQSGFSFRNSFTYFSNFNHVGFQSENVFPRLGKVKTYSDHAFSTNLFRDIKKR